MTTPNAQDFLIVVKSTPLVSIDLVLRDPAECILLGWRNNEPAKHTYFVPGGVVRKDERLDDAFQRLLAVETGLSGERRDAQFLGVKEHFYPTNRFGDTGFGTHYIVLGYRLSLSERPNIRLDDQHSDYRWMSEAELLTHAEVHQNTKAYFQC